MTSSNADCRVYVGNLDRGTTWQRLKDHMKNAGPVLRADIFEDPHTNRSKGCGLVEYQHPEDAERAINTLTDSELDGRQIFVREDREAGDNGRSRGPAPRRREYRDRPSRDNNYRDNDRDRGDREYRGRPRDMADTKGRQVFVSNLAWSVDWAALKDHFRAVGDVNYVDLYCLADGRSKGCGTVTFEHPEDALSAIEKFDGTMFLGRPMTVKMDEGRPQRRNDMETSLPVE